MYKAKYIRYKCRTPIKVVVIVTWDPFYKAKYNRYKCRTPVKVMATEMLWNPDWFSSQIY